MSGELLPCTYCDMGAYELCRCQTCEVQLSAQQSLALPGGRVSGGVGEPVAWAVRWSNGVLMPLPTEKEARRTLGDHVGSVVPLYALPPAPSIEESQDE